MIILLGPDNSGKSFLAEKLKEKGLQTWKAVKDTGYDDYMEILSGQKSNPIPLGSIPFTPGTFLEKGTHYVADRFFWCELPYSQVYRQEPSIKYSLKQFHNLHLATIAHNPAVILMKRKPEVYLDNYLPEEYFTPILESYRTWLTALDVEYLEWDWKIPEMSVDDLIAHSATRQEHVVWWRNLAKRGIAGFGNTVNPRAIIVAEVLSANNVYHYPFEQGPSGYYLSELLDEANVPLSSFYITNWKKTNNAEENKLLLAKELHRTGASHAVLLGGEARKSEEVFKLNGFDASRIHYLKHPGWVVNHSETIREMERRKADFSIAWKSTWGKILGGDEPYVINPETDKETVWVE